MTPKPTTLPVKPTTLPALLGHQAHERGSKHAYTYLADGERESRTLTFGELDLEARAVAAGLQGHLSPGDRVLVPALDGMEFIRGFLGCQYAGVIPVPASLPFPVKSQASVRTLCAIAHDCGARAVLSDVPSDLCELIRGVATDELARIPWLAVNGIALDTAAQLHPVNVRPQDIAFLQYTSGSTSTPKGVIVTHQSLLQNEELIKHWLGVKDDDSFVNWLPLFHDMGLIGNVLQVLYSGAHAAIMPPFAFVQRPERWLRAISRYRGTISGSPNFGYELCARRIAPEDCADLDLSSWRWAYDGAEPIRASTLHAFSKAFRPYGFDGRALAPCYGLAECTLLAVGSERERGPTQMAVAEDALSSDRLVPGNGRTLVASGVPMLHRRVEIVDPASRRRLGHGEIGEIWIAGPDIARGYWGRRQESEDTFGARVADDGDGPFLRTGDLGAVYDGHLFVTGRLKDLIIVAGRNHYPQDLEATVEEAHPAIRRGCCAAFALECDGAERVIVVAEVRPEGHEAGVDLDELRRAVRSAVARDHDVNVSEVALVAPHSVPKTSSGKLQRSACRLAFEHDELPVVLPAVEEMA
jgi:acyl-CoA synthetase (AMP-forming)/AMP-acid ligase II